MYDCFTNSPEFTPYESVPNLIALDEMNPDPEEISDSLIRSNAIISAQLNLKK